MKRLSRSRSFLYFLACSMTVFVMPSAVAHEPINWNGDKVHVILEKSDTNESMGMFTVEFDGPKGPPRHVHEDADEAFYVLEGEAEILVDGETQIIGAGEGGFAPKGSEHTFKMTEDSGGKILVVVTPGGFEGFFGATVDLKLPEQMPELKKISTEFGQKLTGPPLGKE